MTEQEAYELLDGRGIPYLERLILAILRRQGGTANQIAEEVRRLKACEAECERLRAENVKMRAALQSRLDNLLQHGDPFSGDDWQEVQDLRSLLNG